jgi:hypothetical protein
MEFLYCCVLHTIRKRVALEYTSDFFQSVNTAEDDETQLEFEPIVGGTCR